jgi:hypothetical protein
VAHVRYNGTVVDESANTLMRGDGMKTYSLYLE